MEFQNQNNSQCTKKKVYPIVCSLDQVWILIYLFNTQAIYIEDICKLVIVFALMICSVLPGDTQAVLSEAHLAGYLLHSPISSLATAGSSPQPKALPISVFSSFMVVFLSNTRMASLLTYLPPLIPIFLPASPLLLIQSI